MYRTVGIHLLCITNELIHVYRTVGIHLLCITNELIHVYRTVGIHLLCITNEYLPYDTHESFPTQQRKRMVVDPVNQYQKLYLQLYELPMIGVYTRNM